MHLCLNALNIWIRRINLLMDKYEFKSCGGVITAVCQG